MDKLNKIFSRDNVSVFIDLLYGITSVQIDFYRAFVGLIGTFYLYCLFPNGLASKICGQIPQAFLEEDILSGLFSKAIIFLFLMYEVIRAVNLLFGHSLKENFYTVYEIIVGSILVAVSITVIPIITFDRVFMTFGIFILFKLILRAIIRIFKISTRHFGSFEKEVIYLEFPMLGNKQD